MHTATQLSAAQFSIEIEGSMSTREELLPAWGPLDRLGIVVAEPLGGVGASLLIQVAITAFYDCRPQRRADHGTIYPEFYVFHATRRHGDHSWFDFWPERKEIVVRDAGALLEAVNDRAISRLLVPDGRPAPLEYRAKEVDAFCDRITSAFCYSPGGRVTDSDVVIRGLVAQTEANVINTLSSTSAGALTEAEEDGRESDEEGRRWRARYVRRLREVTAEERSAVAESRRDIVTDARATETYRRIEAGAALSRLWLGST